jgi:hypothetical protein
MEPEVFTDTNESAWSGYRAWEARGKELGLDGPHRLVNPNTCWQFVGKGGTAGIYNAATGKGFIFRDGDSATENPAGEPKP